MYNNTNIIAFNGKNSHHTFNNSVSVFNTSTEENKDEIFESVKEDCEAEDDNSDVY
jgi:hypothetical protein